MSTKSKIMEEYNKNNIVKRTSVRWYIFIAVLVLATINYVDRAVLSVAMPQIQKDLHLNAAITGVILSSFFWGYAAMQIPAGFLLDKYRTEKVVLGSAIGWGLAQTLTGFASSSGVLMALRALLGVTESPVMTAGAKLQGKWLPSKERARGATIVDGGAPLGSAIGGPIIVAFMAWFGGWRGALIGAGLMTIIVGIICYFVIKGDPDTNKRVNAAERQYIQSALKEEYEAAQKEAKIEIGAKQYLQSRNFWGMCLGWFSFNTVFYGLLTWGPTFLAKTQHINISSIGFSTLIIFGFGFIGELTGGILADKWREKGGKYNTVMRTIFAIAGIGTSIAIFLLAKTASLTMAISLLTIALFFLRWAGIFWSVPAAIAQRQHVGVIGGCMNLAGNIAGVITPIYIGLIVQFTGSFYAGLMIFTIAGLLLALSGAIINYEKKIGVV
ncbi:MFS transporter [Desulfosporosinus sp. PR]|uniref:MFS transporter n=1 Tax=Candidatus Desulfosporosinus nitrosoreducens TaxID=3401928 RepID=UPI0027E97728|nr:MFS transporter [Desulfosporosinus sp. PR]MDQ7094378.1 MFS transporter [Desulfosporosinus sp. PR]